MGTWTMWKSLRVKMGRAPIPLLRRQVTVQHLGLPDADLDALQQVFDTIGHRLGLHLELKRHEGDIVLLDVPFASRVSSQLVHALAEGRPVVVIAGMHGDDEWLLNAGERFARRERVLLRQLCELPLVRRRAGGWLGDRWLHDEGDDDSSLAGLPTVTPNTLAPGVDFCFDTPLAAADMAAPPPDMAVRSLLQHVLAGRHDPQHRPLTASYGPGAHLRIHFHTGLVHLDLPAQRLLRVHRELPRLLPDTTDMAPGFDAVVRELDDTLWDLGIASGAQPLLQEPADWWRAPLQLRPGAVIADYSRAPRHLELARCLEEGPTTPALLSRRARINTGDLRAFVQACLVLDLVTWCTLRSVQR